MINLYNTALAPSTKFSLLKCIPSRTQPGPPSNAVLVHGVQLPLRQFFSALLSLGWICYHFMHVREVNPLVNSSSIDRIKAGPEQFEISIPSTVGNRTQFKGTVS
jgi:hypothetical protein